MWRQLLVLCLAVPALAGDVPDPAITPGLATEMTAAEVCARAWGRDVRHVTPAMRRQVLAAYAGTQCRPDAHGRTVEVDHLISRELGGADAVGNLWKQCYRGRWNAAMKDRLENRLHREVCVGRLDLRQAQEAIRADWRVVYRRYFGEPP